MFKKKTKKAKKETRDFYAKGKKRLSYHDVKEEISIIKHEKYMKPLLHRYTDMFEADLITKKQYDFLSDLVFKKIDSGKGSF